MMCFEVELNGVRLCTAGAEELATLSVHLTWARRELGGSVEELLNLRASGAKPDLEQLIWTQTEGLKIGDEITIKIVESADPDLPTVSDLLTSEMKTTIQEMVSKISSQQKDND